MSNEPAYEQIQPDLDISYLEKLLASIHMETIWKWTLQVQDQLLFQAEKSFLDQLNSFKEPGEFLDVSWGYRKPLVSHKRDFEPHCVTEMGLSLDYLFTGNTKAKKYLRDIATEVELGKRFDWIRLYLVAQHVRHHGVLLEGLKNHLNERGKILVVDVKDDHLKFNPSPSYLRFFYEQLKIVQKESGGLRSAADRIKQRASVFGYRLVEGNVVPVPTKSKKDTVNYYRMMCLHGEVLSRSFAGKFDRIKIMEEAKLWLESEDPKGSIGLNFIVVEKKKLRGRKRSSGQ